MAAHQPTIPSSVSIAGGTKLAFLSSLQVQDRSFLKDLLEVYGPESYLYLMELLGKKSKVENETFYHYQRKGKRFIAVQVASKTGGASAGVDCVVTIASGSHQNSGAESPLRVGEVVEISASGIMGKITAIDKSVASAHTATIKPLRTAETFGPANNDYLLFKGLQDVGEASSAFESQQSGSTKISNTVTQIREDYKITDKAAMEALEWEVDGQKYYKYKGTKDAEIYFLNSVEDKLVFGVDVTNTGITVNGTNGSKGLVTQITAGGSDLGYTAGSLAITDFQSITRQLTFNGAAAEIHHLTDIYQYQEIMRSLFALYPQGAVLWDSVGGSEEAAAKYGFKSLNIEGFNFHWKKYAPFSPEWKYGVTPGTASNYKNYGLVIPVGGMRDPESGNTVSTFDICYQDIPNAGEINAYEWGGLARQNKNGDQVLYNTFITHKGLRLRAANQCVILNG